MPPNDIAELGQYLRRHVWQECSICKALENVCIDWLVVPQGQESLLSCSNNSYNSIWLLMALSLNQLKVSVNRRFVGSSETKHLQLLKSAKNMGKWAKEHNSQLKETMTVGKYFSFHRRLRTLRILRERAVLQQCSAASVKMEIWNCKRYILLEKYICG